MGTLFTILAILFVSLFILVTLLERFGKPMSREDMSKISRWIIPLMVILLLVQGLRYMFG